MVSKTAAFYGHCFAALAFHHPTNRTKYPVDSYNPTLLYATSQNPPVGTKIMVFISDAVRDRARRSSFILRASISSLSPSNDLRANLHDSRADSGVIDSVYTPGPVLPLWFPGCTGLWDLIPDGVVDSSTVLFPVLYSVSSPSATSTLAKMYPTFLLPLASSTDPLDVTGITTVDMLVPSYTHIQEEGVEERRIYESGMVS